MRGATVRSVRWLLVLSLTGCHFGWSGWQGARPRTGNEVRLALYAADESSKALARQVLARDPLVTVTDVDPALVVAANAASCGDSPCPVRLEDGCAWARAQQLDYYAVASAKHSYTQQYKCTAYELTLDILDPKKETPCKAGHYENQQTSAAFMLDVYRTDTCTREPSVSTSLSTVAKGEEEHSKPEALARLQQIAPAQAIRFPDQIDVGPSGTIEAADGYYALYRRAKFRGFVSAKAGRLRSLHCCDTPGPGDKLVARGPRKLMEFALNGVVASMTVDTVRRGAGGAGFHVRYYPLDSGVRFGAGVDYLVNPGAGAGAFVITPELGWGFRPSRAFSLSANLGFGLVQAFQNPEGMTDTASKALGGHLMPTLRAVTFFAKAWYVGGDVGYLYSSALDTWEGEATTSVKTMSLRTPIARLWVGVDL